MAIRNSSFAKGFDRGNYGNAYESQDWDTWYAENCVPPKGARDPKVYAEGLILGFFSSYEVSEIEDPEAACSVQCLRTTYP